MIISTLSSSERAAISTIQCDVEGIFERNGKGRCRFGPAVCTSPLLARDGVDCALGRRRSEALQACGVDGEGASQEMKVKERRRRQAGGELGSQWPGCGRQQSRLVTVAWLELTGMFVGRPSRWGNGREDAVRIRRANLLASRDRDNGRCVPTGQRYQNSRAML